MNDVYPVSILHKSIADRYRPVRGADGPITARYRFIKNACRVVRVERDTQTTSEKNILSRPIKNFNKIQRNEISLKSVFKLQLKCVNSRFYCFKLTCRIQHSKIQLTTGILCSDSTSGYRKKIFCDRAP